MFQFHSRDQRDEVIHFFTDCSVMECGKVGGSIFANIPDLALIFLMQELSEVEARAIYEAVRSIINSNYISSVIYTDFLIILKKLRELKQDAVRRFNEQQINYVDQECQLMLFSYWRTSQIFIRSTKYLINQFGSFMMS